MSEKYKHIFILTGAGISAASGVKTFRDNGGLWENHRVEDVATAEAFHNNPDLVYKFYNLRRAQLKDVTANVAHQALSKLQKEFKGRVTLVTQNVDDLHERGGSSDVIHMHGQLKEVRCQKTQKVFTWKTDCDGASQCPCCNEAGNLRPNIVWFGEIPFFMDEIEKSLMQCDLFICIGTSGVVYPAAGFVQYAKANGAYAIECNMENTNISPYFERSIQGCSTKTIVSLVDEILLGIDKISTQ